MRNSLGQLIGTIAHHCDSLSDWPQLLAFLEQFVKSEHAGERQVAMLILKTVSSEAGDLLQPHLFTILDLCASALYDENPVILYYTVLLVPYLSLSLHHIRPSESHSPSLYTVCCISQGHEQPCHRCLYR